MPKVDLVPVPEIDTRREDSVIDVFKYRGLPYIEKKLDCGDIHYEDLRIERKTMADFYNSFCYTEKGKSKPRGWDQAERLSNSDDFVIILIVGDWDDFRTSRWFIAKSTGRKIYVDEKAYWGARCSLWADFGIATMVVEEKKKRPMDMYVNVALMLMHMMDKGGFKRRLTRLNKEIDDFTRSIAGYYEVHQDIAEGLIKKYGTLRKMLAARKKDLLKIDKIGPKTTAKILKKNAYFDE